MKERYHGMNAYVEMTQEVDSSMLASLGARRRRRLLIVIAALLAVVVIAPQVLVTPELYGWLSEVAPPIAQLLSPRRGGVEESGIRMEVVSATIHADVMEIEVTFEDLEYDRINENTRPCDWTIVEQSPYSRELAECSYDEQTGKLRCRFRFTDSDDWERSTTLYVEYLERDDGREITGLPVDITLTDSSELSIQHHEYVGGKLREPIETSLVQLQEGRDITCMTIIDGDLHIQTRLDEDIAAGTYNLMLTGPKGELVSKVRIYNFREAGVLYEHQVFNLAGRDIEACTLTVYLDPKDRVTGPWIIPLVPEKAQ